MFESVKVKEQKLDFHGPFFKANYIREKWPVHYLAITREMTNNRLRKTPQNIFLHGGPSV